ncbi:EpsG family protein [Bacillus sp. UMB0893]|uniref:EpsG family protein n=1 Tax=Bacillus sp. UMB0893 TaxID=2066053 RepID=UPI000C759618|nr:EpsG family protein [Bacillus sp. UMB0893]PLR68739.1 EpsG family protein [Bacillus sp. UMB0893]
MTILWINLTAVYIFSFFARYFSKPLSFNNTYQKLNPFLVILTISCLVIVSGLRNNIGDTPFYVHSYILFNYSLYELDYTGDFGFSILQLLLKNISNDPQILLFVTALITNSLIVIVLYRYSRIFELSIYVYITSGMYTVSMNGIRQYFAAAIVFLGTKFILNGEIKKYLLTIIIASTFHKSAIVLLPIYFIVRREAWTKMTVSILLTSILIVIGYNEFSTILFTALKTTQYAHYSEFQEGGASYLRVAVNIVPLIIAYIGKEKLKSLWPKSGYIVNLSIINFLFLVISTQNWIFARFSIYFGLYNLILISWLIVLFKNRNKRIIYYCILIFYIIYFYYEHVLALDVFYESNYL